MKAAISGFIVWRILRKRFWIWSRSLPQTYSMAMKCESSTRPSSKIWQMLAWLSCPQIFASSMNISMKSASSAIDGRMRLMARIFSKPSTPKDLALKTSAMPPTLMRSSKTYLPNGIGCRNAPRLCPRT